MYLKATFNFNVIYTTNLSQKKRATDGEGFETNVFNALRDLLIVGFVVTADNIF